VRPVEGVRRFWLVVIGFGHCQEHADCAALDSVVHADVHGVQFGVVTAAVDPVLAWPVEMDLGQGVGLGVKVDRLGLEVRREAVAVRLLLDVEVLLPGFPADVQLVGQPVYADCLLEIDRGLLLTGHPAAPPVS
jgi:hypothetical protein